MSILEYTICIFAASPTLYKRINHYEYMSIHYICTFAASPTLYINHINISLYLTFAASPTFVASLNK